MNLYPAIDLRDGNVVRLYKGDFSAETVYGDDPVGVAKAFEDAGAQWVHVVDLDAAKSGTAQNREVIASMAAALSIPVQSGGGVRDRDSALALLNTGVQRIVIGTAAHENPELVDQLAAEFPSRIAVGLDARQGIVATRGWVEGSGVSTLDLVKRFEDVGVAAFIVTDIERDGTLNGPDVSGLSEIVAATSVDVIASGGVGELDDLRALAAVESNGRRLAGVITGKAIYENKFSVADAIDVLGGGR
jgi:phosphoribosylformimino-5-aminoimidazole carboxamide ribotide isomerase